MKCTSQPLLLEYPFPVLAMAEERTIRFSLSAAAAGSKRVAETPMPTKPNVPRVSELKMMEPRVTIL